MISWKSRKNFIWSYSARHMLDIMYILNGSNLPGNSVLVSWDIVNVIFAVVDYESDMKSMKVEA